MGPSIFINAGHFSRDKGAIVGKYREGNLVMGIRDELKKIMPNAMYVPDDLSLKLSIDWINQRCKPGDVAIGIHLNANSNKLLSGTECYYYKNHKLALDLSAIVSTFLKVPNRGAKPDTQAAVGSLGFVRQLKCSSVVLECGYMTNLFDMSKITAYDGYSRIASAIKDLFYLSDEDELRKEISELKKVIDILVGFISTLLGR